VEDPAIITQEVSHLSVKKNLKIGIHLPKLWPKVNSIVFKTQCSTILPGFKHNNISQSHGKMTIYEVFYSTLHISITYVSKLVDNTIRASNLHLIICLFLSFPNWKQQ